MINNKKGITLVALVITIIILIILAGVTMVVTLSDDGIISRAKEAGFKSNFSEVQEKTLLFWTNKEQEDILLGKSSLPEEKLPLGSRTNITTTNNSTLIAEIKEIYGDADLNINDLRLYEIDKSEIDSNVPHKYIIDLEDLQIYDVDGEYFKGKTHHTLRGLGVEGTGENTGSLQEVINEPAVTNPKVIYKGKVGWLEPDMTGFNVNYTWMIYYNKEYTKSKEVLLRDYLNNRENEIINEGETYYLDDYTEQRWANIKTFANGTECWWVWVPRYYYKINGENQNPPIDVVFVDMNNTQLRKEDAVISTEDFASYELHPSFTEQYKEQVNDEWVTTYVTDGQGNRKELQGIWMSKYEPSNLTNETRVATSGKCYPPDLDGFDRNNTWIEYINSNNTFTEGPKIADANLENENNNTNWYDYANKKWANIKTKANDTECWWVWIPRYAYCINDTNQEVDIIFVDTNNTPYDKATYGAELSSLMQVHPAFTETWTEEVNGEEVTRTKELKGIWMAKYEPSNGTNETRIASSGECYKPDMTGFNEDTTWMIYYTDDFSKSREVSLREYKSGNEQRQITYQNETYTLYSYNHKHWANIKTVVNELECWWVWIPRYAYVVEDAAQEMGVIFVDLDNKPYDTSMYGNELGNGLSVHLAFTETWTDPETGEEKTKELKGIWMSKYEPSWTPRDSDND